MDQDIDDLLPEETHHEITNVKYEDLNLKYKTIDQFALLKEEIKHVINKTIKSSDKSEDVINAICKITTNPDEFVKLVSDFCYYVQTSSISESIQKLKTNYNPFMDFEDQYEKEIRNLEKPVKIEEVDGIYECRKCGSKKTYYWSAQLRRSDEPPTTFINCTNCKNKWVDNG